MSKEISFQGHVKQVVSVEVQEEHMEKVRDLQKEALMFYVKYHDFRHLCASFQKEIIRNNGFETPDFSPAFDGGNRLG